MDLQKQRLSFNAKNNNIWLDYGRSIIWYGSPFEFNRTKISFSIISFVCVQHSKKVKPSNAKNWLSKCKRFVEWTIYVWLFTVCLDPNGSPLFCSDRKREANERKTMVCSIRTVDNNALNVKYISPLCLIVLAVCVCLYEYDRFVSFSPVRISNPIFSIFIN